MRTCVLPILLGSMLCIGLGAQDASNDKDKSGGKGTTVTGCLTKGTDGAYVLTNENTGKQITVTGNADLEKHSANHKVRLTGTETTSGGTMTMEVTKIQHISPTCTPAGK